ncbi:MAG: iron-containing alcohol dehydrogenase [Planctomyces sp.]|nr:iron-containing alcohol dehydrogenase [Planctomyces sp.]
MNFDLRLPEKLIFGWGRRVEAGGLARSLGTRAWLVAGSRTLEASGATGELCRTLEETGIGVRRLPVLSREPEVEDVDAAVAEVRGDLQPGDFVLGLGGGAAIDLAKAVSGLAPQESGTSVRDYLEGVGRGLQLIERPLPLLAMPTTSGTGAEATKNAVISCSDPPFKKSLRDERLVPAAVLIDPELTVSNPASVTAHSGMDAITQLIESYVTKKATPFTRALCREGLRLAIPALPAAVERPTDRGAREGMAYAAWLSGVALANSGLGLAHGVAAALGVHCQVPHGLACAALLPTAMRFNRDVRLREFAELGALFTGQGFASDAESADAAIGVIEELSQRVGVPQRLRDLGVREGQLDALAPASRGNSLSGNPREIDDAGLRELLGRLW